MLRRFAVVSIAFSLVLGLAAARLATAQTIPAPFSSFYSFTDFGSVAGLPSPYGGATFAPGNPNVLLVGGNANSSSGAIYSLNVVRGVGNHITGFTGSPTLFADADNIDGGLAVGPGNVLFFTRWPSNEMGQIKPGSAVTDKVLSLTPLGVSSSVGSLNFVPAGMPGAGRLKLLSYSTGQWSDAQYAADGAGTFNLLGVTPIAASQLSSGGEGFVYVPPMSPGFSSPSLLVAEWSTGTVSAYEINANGDPIVATKRTFMSGLSSAEGAAIDPLTGDLFLTTWGGGRILKVQGFVPEPSTWCLAAMGVVGMWIGVRKRLPSRAR